MKKVNSNIFRYLVILFISLTVGISESMAQKYEIGGGIGGATYSGDIIRKVDLGQIGFQGTLFGKRNFDNVWTLRVALSTAILHADDEVRPLDLVAKSRDARFKGGVIEASAVMEFNFLDFLRNDSEFRWSPYAFFGIGFSYFTMKGRPSAERFTPADYYQLTSPVIPFGGGVKYRLNDRWTLAGELGFRPTFTDYLDKIDSKAGIFLNTEVDPNTGTTPSQIINFGNPNTKDWYYFLGLTVSYTFANVKCYAY
ncbi:type IX secretion system protein PorG [Algoriphagus sp. oki45]|uniref:type IX secretion system protein PorG n=1 Tax=Algoriphagus sp. oki45 TaxID=3067294 RepID=UPI0030C738DC